MGGVDAGLGCLLCIGLLGEWDWSRRGRLVGGLAGRVGRVGRALQTNKLGVGSSCHASRFEEAYRRDSHGEGFRGESIVV